MASGELYDISPLVSPRIAVFPGDTPYRSRVLMDFKKGDNLVLSAIETTVHLGAHVDAPIHYHRGGEAMHDRSLHYYLGPCQVISVRKKPGERIRAADIADVKISAERVLFNTGSFPDPDRWTDDFNALSAELVDELARRKVILIGIDTPSVDPSKDKELESHQAIYRHKMANLEGIVLKGVPDGIYTLIALPLRLENSDASPVRAVLMKGDSAWKK